MDIQKLINREKKNGYNEVNARAKVCQDIIIKALSDSSLSHNVTIKGGVVMRSISNNIRRATQDIDIDFIKYPLTDEAIDAFVRRLNVFPDIKNEQIGDVKELNQQDYKGKSISIRITDIYNTALDSKIDLGVHKRFEIEQEEYCFDISLQESRVSLLINSKEQMFTEKLRSLLKFGIFSTRYKDIYDMYYYGKAIEKDKMLICLNSYIFKDPEMRESNMEDVIARVEKVFSNNEYRKKVDKSDKRWLDEDIDTIFTGIITRLKEFL